jgi:hypothetical protein
LLLALVLAVSTAEVCTEDSAVHDDVADDADADMVLDVHEDPLGVLLPLPPGAVDTGVHVSEMDSQVPLGMVRNLAGPLD